MPSDTTVGEPWASALEDAGFIDPVKGRPSVRQLAKAVDVSPATLHRAVAGQFVRRGLSVETTAKVAAALGKSFDEIQSWLNAAMGEDLGRSGVGANWKPPGEIAYLDKEDIQVLEIMIFQLAKRKKPQYEWNKK